MAVTKEALAAALYESEPGRAALFNHLVAGVEKGNDATAAEKEAFLEHAILVRRRWIRATVRSGVYLAGSRGFPLPGLRGLAGFRDKDADDLVQNMEKNKQPMERALGKERVKTLERALATLDEADWKRRLDHGAMDLVVVENFLHALYDLAVRVLGYIGDIGAMSLLKTVREHHGAYRKASTLVTYMMGLLDVLEPVSKAIDEGNAKILKALEENPPAAEVPPYYK